MNCYTAYLLISNLEKYGFNASVTYEMGDYPKLHVHKIRKDIRILESLP